ncbi:MAG TPA: M50 family metallopeptidase [Planctomycetota bacterium]|nr:M50 family metallopeptidase [Planctomycetota bacterium]
MGRNTGDGEGFSVFRVITHCFLICVVFYFWTSPVIHPLKLMVVLFHEMSHGLMAILTGGRILSIVITADEGGACETEGGIALLIVSAGYLGSMFFGGLLLYLSRFREYIPGVCMLLTLALGAGIFTVLHDAYSRTFATGLAGSFIFVGLLLPSLIGILCLRIIGTVSCLYSIFDIYWDILARSHDGHTPENDAVAFSQLTGIDARAVGLLWLGLSFIYFLVILKIMVSNIPATVVPSGAQRKPSSAEA